MEDTISGISKVQSALPYVTVRNISVLEFAAIKAIFLTVLVIGKKQV